MAHCVHLSEDEQQQLKKRGVLISHCPSSNINLSSGIAPVRKYLLNGIAVSLGTDIAGGFDLSVFRAMTDAIQVSKIHALYSNAAEKPLGISEAFYMGTKGAMPLFGKVGSFEKGFEFDAVVLDDSSIMSSRQMETTERIERAIYLEKELKIITKFVSGRQIFG